MFSGRNDFYPEAPRIRYYLGDKAVPTIPESGRENDDSAEDEDERKYGFLATGHNAGKWCWQESRG